MTENQARASRTVAYVWGYNNSGALGLGHSARACQPVRARLPEGTVDVQGGGEFTVARTVAGELYAVGGNAYGQLGDGTTRTRLTWARVPLPPDAAVTGVQAGTDHVLALTERGEVFAWGRNHRGQAGTGSAGSQLTPHRVIDGGMTGLGAGNAVSAAIAADGQLLTWGRNGSRQVGGSAGDITTPAPGLLPPGVRAAAVDAGYYHLVVLTSAGDVLAFGSGMKGERLSGPVTLDRSWGEVRAIRAGESFTLALTSRGLLLGWGANSAGQLGVGDLEHRFAPTVAEFPNRAAAVTGFWAGDHSAVAVTTDHEVYSWGQTRWGQGGTGGAGRPQPRPNRITRLDGAHLTAVHGGANHVIATA